MMKGYCLYAISGDCAAGAMSGSSDYIPLKDSHRDLIKTFLREQLEWELNLAEKGYESTSKEDLDSFSRAGHALLEAGIFKHKYHLRTTWALWEMDGDEPANVPDNLNRVDV